jgi:voltage-gated potassium channel
VAVDPDRLAAHPLFRSLDAHERGRVAELACERRADAGERIVRQGEFGADVYAIEAGRVQVERNARAVAELGPGEFFGEVAVVDWWNADNWNVHRRNASVIALEPTVLIEIGGREFKHLVRTLPEVAERVSEAVRSRSYD